LREAQSSKEEKKAKRIEKREEKGKETERREATLGVTARLRRS